MAHPDDWFRRSCVTDAEREAFETRLARTRSSRPEYMRIQALALAESGHHELALQLLNRTMDDYPDYGMLAWMIEEMGGSLEALGRIDEALESYERAIRRVNDHPGTQGNAPIHFARLVLAVKRVGSYEQALTYLSDFWDPSPIFPYHEFMQFGLNALLLDALGHSADAIPSARRAISAAEKQHSNAANHRSLGLVGDSQMAMRQQLEQLVGNSPPSLPQVSYLTGWPPAF